MTESHLDNSTSKSSLTLESAYPSVVSRIRRGSVVDSLVDADAVLADEPRLWKHKSAVIDLAYEEYCQRVENGEDVDVNEFCQRFSRWSRSLRRVLEVHEFLEINPDLFTEAEVEWPESGDEFHGFSIELELGRGAFGRVYLAREIGVGNRPVAVKVSVDGTAEADILGRLGHTGIVPIYSVKQDRAKGLSLICMPFLGGATLQDVLDTLFVDGHLPRTAKSILTAAEAVGAPVPSTGQEDPPEDVLLRGSYVDGVLHLGTQLAEALAYAHSIGICHADIKPSNVLVTPNGCPMLLDFNLAFDAQVMPRKTGGTLPYMAPERLLGLVPSPGEQGSRKEYDVRSDVFSLGAVLYELFTGVHPFGLLEKAQQFREVGMDLLERQRQGPQPLRRKNHEVDRRLAALIESCLAFDLSARPGTAEELAHALRECQGVKSRAVRWSRRHWLLSGGIAACSLVATIVAGGAVLTRPEYGIRKFNQGGRHYLNGNFERAEECFSEAIDHVTDDPLLVDALFWRAKSRVNLDQFAGASEDFARAMEAEPRADYMAHWAYLCARCEELPIADSQYYGEQAIEAGAVTAEVLNNLGYAQLESGGAQMAIDSLDKAVQMAPELRCARYNRAMARFQLGFQGTNGSSVKQSLEDIEVAISSGPPNAYLYYDAALLYRDVADRNGSSRQKLREYLRKSLELGAPTDLARKIFPLDFDEAWEVATGPAATRSIDDRLADPLASNAFPFR